MEYASIEQARSASGLRLVLSAGVPGPWGESAKAIFDFKALDYLPVRQEGGGRNVELLAWTGQTSAPVAVYDDLPPACHWLDLVMLAERLAPEKPLLPLDEEQRIQVLGIAAELAGVDGFAWNRRHQLLAPGMALPDPPESIARLASKYGYSDAALGLSFQRMDVISAALERRLVAQEAQSSPYLVGDTLSVADIYCANFIGMIKPLPHDANPMPDFMRQTYTCQDPRVLSFVTGRLERHRDFIYREHISLPLHY